jgi:hypothetical protein
MPTAQRPPLIDRSRDGRARADARHQGAGSEETHIGWRRRSGTPLLRAEAAGGRDEQSPRDRSTNRNRRRTAEMTELRKIDVAAGKGTAGPAFAVGQSLAAPLLYRRCDPAELPFAVCTELEEAPGLIGQERAVEAVQFAMRMRRKGYNVYCLVLVHLLDPERLLVLLVSMNQDGRS